MNNLSKINKKLIVYPGIPIGYAMSAVNKFWDDKAKHHKGFGIKECVIYDYGDAVLVVYETKTSFVIRDAHGS